MTRVTRARLLLASSLLVLPLVASCSAGSDDADPSSSSSPVATPTGSPFSFTITGPETAEIGQQVTAVLTNTGRLPNRYRLVPDPVDAFAIAEPEVSVSPGESVDITLVPQELPAIVRVQSITSAGEADGPYLSIGVSEPQS